MRRLDDTGSARRQDARKNALWGGRRKLHLLALAVSAIVAVLGATATPASASQDDAYVTPWLLSSAQANPDQLFTVIVQARAGKKTMEVGDEVSSTLKDEPAAGSSLRRKFASIEGAAATLNGKQILKLAKKKAIASITADTTVELTASNRQIWPAAAGAVEGWSSTLPDSSYPAIAVVDSGITNLMLGSRLIKSVSMVSASTSTAAYGHGSLVASIAAGQNEGYTGTEPRAKIVSVKVLDGNGLGLKSDVIAACDWILANKAAYNIRVANFSLNTGGESVRYDALNRAVERLWFAGVTVVAASGNYAFGGARSDVGFAPANDPFVITVGASDVNRSTQRTDDFAAPWSAWGRTQDGFAKPELAAPGRVMIGSFPTGATLALQYPARVVASNYMWMSGTSLAAPVVSGLAAAILAKNPTWTPDQVKGALMAAATPPTGYTPGGALGVGVVNGAGALGTSGNANPNLALNGFVSTATGSPVFDAEQWYRVASSNASWNSASWASASWASASWSSASWANASWSSASWANASWANASWANASWANSTELE